MKYGPVILNKEVAPRFCALVDYFLKNDRDDDEAVAEVLDFMYDTLVATAAQSEDQNSTLFP